MTKISKFANALGRNQVESSTVERFIENIAAGLWQDVVLPVRAETDKAAQREKKKKLPAFTLSGTFSEGRTDANLIEHSGFLAIDIDDLGDSVSDVKDLLSQDPYVAAMFTSVGGYGLCILVRIKGSRHADAFDGLQSYFFSKYRIVIDPTGRNVSRLRFVSYDPEASFNAGSKTFTSYLEKHKPADTRGIYFSSGDLTHVFNQIAERKIDITGGYLQWLSICFAISDHFGEAGRERFHAVSRFSSLYDPAACDRQYDVALRRSVSRKVTIATFLYHAKQHGISIASETTRSIVAAAKMGRNGSGTPEGTIRILDELDGIPPEMSEEVVRQVYADAKEPEPESLPPSVQLRNYWRHYQSDVTRNSINKRAYRGNTPLAEGDIIDIAYNASEVLGKDVTPSAIFDILKSSCVRSFNPIRDFFNGMPLPARTGHMDALAACLDTPPEKAAYAAHMLKKWLVSTVASAFGEPSQTCLVLKGKQGGGKSHFFLHLLPETFAAREEMLVEGFLQRGGESANRALMAHRWIVLDDEFQSMANTSENAFKAAISARRILVRLPYERITEELPKLATFAATTNDEHFLTDTTGNRRFIVIDVGDLDQAAYNAIDKLELWREVYHTYLQFREEMRFDADDFKAITELAEESRQPTMEEEMVQARFAPCLPDEGEWLSATKICHALELQNPGKKLDLDKMSKALRRLGFDHNGGRARKVAGQLSRGYWVKYR